MKVIKILLIIMWTCAAKWGYIQISQVDEIGTKSLSSFKGSYLDALYASHYEFDITKTVFCLAFYLLVLIWIILGDRKI